MCMNLFGKNKRKKDVALLLLVSPAALSTIISTTLHFACFAVAHESFHFFQTEPLNDEYDIDPDILNSMTSLGCFKDKMQLIERLLSQE